MNKLNLSLLAISALVLTACSHEALLPKKEISTEAPVEQETSTESSTGEEASEGAEVSQDEGIEAVAVEIKNFTFSPNEIKVKAGGLIKITNLDSVAHSFTSDDGTSFDIQNIEQDVSFTAKAPTEPGTYDFHCTPHPYMKGELVVE